MLARSMAFLSELATNASKFGVGIVFYSEHVHRS